MAVTRAKRNLYLIESDKNTGMKYERNDYLDTAKELINGNRAKDYGDGR